MKFKFWSPELSFRDDLEAGTARKLWHPKAPDPGRSELALLLICHPGWKSFEIPGVPLPCAFAILARVGLVAA
jgi:hypothetical protein